MLINAVGPIIVIDASRPFETWIPVSLMIKDAPQLSAKQYTGGARCIAVYSPLTCIQLTLQTARVAGMPIDRIIFEFTESEKMGSPEHVSSIIDTYKGIGFKVAIDDFGAGHSGINMFARFVPDMIKLDMELVRDVDRDPRRQAIIRGVVQMCSELDTIVIAEGIETASEARVLCDLGVRYHQGFWYARPALGALPSVSLERAIAGRVGLKPLVPDGDVCRAARTYFRDYPAFQLAPILRSLSGTNQPLVS